MLLKTVEFDAETITRTNDREYNIMFLRTVEISVNDILRHRGYIYLNQIYEQLGVEWNPYDENPCIRNDINRAFIEFEVFNKPNDSFLVHIHCYN